MTTIDVDSLIEDTDEDTYFALGLDVARALDLPVDSWRTGDPTRSDYKFIAEALAKKDPVVSSYVRSAFLSKATGDWLKVVAWELFGVEVPEAQHATPTVTVVNSGGGFYPLEPGEMVFKCTATGKTFHSTSGPIIGGIETSAIAGGQTAVFNLEADEAGSDSTVSANEIDEILTTKLGVVIVSSTAGVGADAPTDPEIRTLCTDTLGALSPNGPADAYAYVCKNSKLTGVTEITRAEASGDSTTGLVTVYVASASGTVTSPSVDAAQLAVLKWATPLCISPTVASAFANPIAITMQVLGDNLPSDFENRITAKLGALFALLKIGGTVYRSALVAAAHLAVPEIRSVVLITPAADVAMTAAEVPTLDVVTVGEVV